MASCSACGRTFEPARDYHKKCWACWRNDRDAGDGRDTEYQRGYAAGLRDGRAWSRPSRETGLPDLNEVLLRQAVQLCHPDRHPPERAQLANATTAELLTLLKQVAA